MHSGLLYCLKELRDNSFPSERTKLVERSVEETHIWV